MKLLVPSMGQSHAFKRSENPYNINNPVPPSIPSAASTDQQTALNRVNVYGPYGYQPSLAGAIVFCSIFAILTSVVTTQTLRRRRWWILATLAFGSFCESAGHAIRIYSHFHTDLVNPYIAQQVLLVITPVFFAAAHFTILTKLCRLYGERYIWPISVKWLIPFFVTLDVVSLAVQGGGSGAAAIDEINNGSLPSVNSKGNIVAGGLAIQLVGYLAFNTLYAIFVFRAHQDYRSGNASGLNAQEWRFIFAAWLSAVFVFGRSVFRIVEMGEGWIGSIATTEWYFLAFDAAFVSIAVLLLTAYSPARHLPILITSLNSKIAPMGTNFDNQEST